MTNWMESIISPLKSASDMAQNLMEIRDQVKFGEAVIELQSKILQAQQGALEVQEREHDLKEKIRELESQLVGRADWDNEKLRYQLTDFGGGTFAYLLRDSTDNGEPEHRLCTDCFQQRRKSILQFRCKTATKQDLYFCPACKTEFSFGVQVYTPIRRVGRRSDWMTN